MTDRIAKTISTISSPYLVLLAFGLATIWTFSGSPAEFPKWAALYVTLPLGLPALFIAVGVARGTITDLHVAVRSQRSIPFILATLGALALSAAYILMGAPRELVALAAALAVCSAIFGTISAAWKISIHSAAYAGSVLIVGQLIDFRFFWLILLLPLIAWARYVRGRHSAAQGVVAALVVSLCVFATLHALGF